MTSQEILDVLEAMEEMLGALAEAHGLQNDFARIEARMNELRDLVDMERTDP